VPIQKQDTRARNTLAASGSTKVPPSGSPSQAAIGLRLLRHAGQTSEADKHDIASNALTYVNNRNQWG
jgi:hypothetical protein